MAKEDDASTLEAVESVQSGSHEKLSPEEEASLIAESNTHKAEANSLFSSGRYDAAIAKYDEAVAICPAYLDYELAVLRSNIAACHLKLDEWKEAVTSATAALDGLDRLDKEEGGVEEAGRGGDSSRAAAADGDGVEEEIVSAGASKAGPALMADSAERRRREDARRIRAKALMRRARARSELGGWASLEGALEDYRALEAAAAGLAEADRRIVRGQLQALPARAAEAKERETAEMWGKLRELGDGLLKPFGLSTDNFKMVKDEKTGGYSMNFQGAGEK